MKSRQSSAIAVILAAAGAACAQPVVDGTVAGDQAAYGPILWSQNQPLAGTLVDNIPANQDPCDPPPFPGIEVAIDNSNVGGVEGGGGEPSLSGDAINVATGVEIKIPLALIGSPAGAFRVCVFVNGGGHDFLSNQVLGPLPDFTGNLGEPRNVDFSLLAGDQFVNVSRAAVGVPVMDGQLDTSVYGTFPDSTQTITTQFGDSNLGVIDFANGSELDNCYAVTDGDNLYLFIGGNLESNFNKLEVFIDSVAGGQNRLRGDNPDIDFNGLNRMGDDSSGNGLAFDAGFEADYYLTFTGGNSPYQTFANFAELPTDGGGIGAFLGSGGAGVNTLQSGQNNCPPVVPSPEWAVGSEIDGIYARIDADTNTLFVLVTGNVRNGNGFGDADKLNLFFDADPTQGQNLLLGTNVDISFGGLNRMGGGAGLKFDEDFSADYWISTHLESLVPRNLAVDSALLRTGGPITDFNGASFDYGCYFTESYANLPLDYSGPRIDGYDSLFGPAARYANYAPRASFDALQDAIIDGLDPVSEADLQARVVPGGITAHIDNSNTAGVTDGDTSGAASVQTGFEIAIDLDELGWDGESPIKIAGFISNPDFSVISNQVVGGLPSSAALGDPLFVDFSMIDGSQYVVVSAAAPCPGDYNMDGVRNTADFFEFFGDFFGTPPDADYNMDGATNTADFFEFFSDFFGPPCA